MRKLMQLMLTLLATFCVATVLSQLIVVGVASSKLKLSRDKLAKAMAVLQGAELASSSSQAKPAAQVSPEQVSFDLVLETRALKSRDLELREQSIKNVFAQFRQEELKVTDEKAAVERLRTSFEQSVAAVQKKSIEAGWDTNRQTLLALQPEQAKELIAQMLAKDEMNDVVALLQPMPDAKRAKILAEFRKPEEAKKVDEMMRLLRRGEPLATTAADTLQQLKNTRDAQLGAP